MNKYITFRDGDNDELEYFILQREFPHYVARLSEVLSENEFYSEKIDGYNLHLAFDGVINGRYVPSYRNTMQDIADVIRDMALWYLLNRISKNEKKYKKFKEDVSITNK